MVYVWYPQPSSSITLHAREQSSQGEPATISNGPVFTRQRREQVHVRSGSSRNRQSRVRGCGDRASVLVRSSGLPTDERFANPIAAQASGAIVLQERRIGGRRDRNEGYD